MAIKNVILKSEMKLRENLQQFYKEICILKKKIRTHPSKEVFSHPRNQILPWPNIQCTNSTNLSPQARSHLCCRSQVRMHQKSCCHLNRKFISTENTVNWIPKYCHHRSPLTGKFGHHAIVIMSNQQPAFWLAAQDTK